MGVIFFSFCSIVTVPRYVTAVYFHNKSLSFFLTACWSFCIVTILSWVPPLTSSRYSSFIPWCHFPVCVDLLVLRLGFWVEQPVPWHWVASWVRRSRGGSLPSSTPLPSCCLILCSLGECIHYRLLCLRLARSLPFSSALCAAAGSPGNLLAPLIYPGAQPGAGQGQKIAERLRQKLLTMC